MASSEYCAPSQEAEQEVVLHEKKITEEDNVNSQPKVSVEIQKPEESASPSPDVKAKVEEGIQETAPLAESERIVDKPEVEERAQEIAVLAQPSKEEKIVEKPEVEEGIAPLAESSKEENIVEKPKVEQVAQEIAPWDQPPAEEKILDKPQEVAQLSQSSTQEKIVEKPEVEEGTREIAALAEPSNDDKIVDKPKVEEGADEIKPLAQSSTEEAIVDEPKVEKGAQEIASLVDSPVEEKTALLDSEQKLQDRPMDPSAAEQQDKIKCTEGSKPTEPEDKPVEEEKKVEDVPVIDAHGKDIQQVGKETDTAEPRKEKLGTDTAENPSVKSVEEMPKEPGKLVDVPASSPPDAIQEKAVVLPSPEVQTDEAKDVAVSETLSKAKETSEPEPGEKPVAESVKGMPRESEKIVDLPGLSPPEAIQEKAVELPSPVVQMDVAKDVAEETSEPTLVPQQSEQVQLIPKEFPDTAAAEKDKSRSSVDEVEDVNLPKEVETSSDQEIALPKVEERDVECYPIDNVLEQKGEEQENTEIKGLPEEAKTVTPKAKAEEKNIVAEELVQREEKITGGVTNSPQLSEKAAEANVISRDIEGTKEAERIKLADKFEEEKHVDEQIKKTAKSTKANLEEEEQVNEPVKADIQTAEVAKDDEETKTSKDITKEDVPVKTNKPSIVKMVKQSLVKAKKAIIGKSHNSKTQVPDGSK